jgi:Resolvase, N terminal domain
MEKELAAGLGEGQVAELVENDEVHAGEMIGDPALPTVAGLGFEPIDEIDDIVEPATGAGADAASRDGDGKMRFAGSGRSSDILPGIRATTGLPSDQRQGLVRLIRTMLMEIATTTSASTAKREGGDITPEHLARGAFIYVRQSTADQLLHNHESRRRQYGLADRARQLGSQEIVVIDDDLGRSGSGVSRPGFERLLDRRRRSFPRYAA